MSDEDGTQDTPQLSDSDSSENESDEEPIESLVAGRERRKTAGNRYDRETILEEAPAEDDPDEVALLFADNEDEVDEEFKSDDGDDEADMSSSDDDDQGPNAAADDLEGEKEIVKQAKDERSKKRKADLALTSVSGLRKKLKTDPTQPNLPAAKSKPSKKKERVTWVHAQDSGRSSLRKQTIAHRAETIQRLKESEAQSKKLKALKEKRDRERAEDAPKELTQADRLAEAARTERQNAKSLNRWEATEKKRQEEQAAKLAALKNRKLEGPVVSWWSAKATWIGPRLNKIGTKDGGDVLEGGNDTGGTITKKKPGRKTKAELERLAAEKNAANNTSETVQPAGMPLPPGVTQPDADPKKTENNLPPVVLPETKPESAGSSQENAADGSATASAVPETREMSTAAQTGPPTNDKISEPQKTADAPEPDPITNSPTAPAVSLLQGIFEYASMDEGAPIPLKGSVDEKRPSGPTMAERKDPDVPMMDDAAGESINTTAGVPATSQITPSNVEPHPQKNAIPNTAVTAQVPPPAPPVPLPAPAPEAEGVRPDDAVHSKDVVKTTQLSAPSGASTSSSSIPPTPTVIGSDVVKSEPLEQPPLEAKTSEVLPEPVVGYSTRNLVILEKFDGLSSQARQDYSLFYNQRKLGKTVKSLKHSQDLCPITALPVRYRDPATGIGFATAAAYKKLQELKDYGFAWSGMLGCYVGRNGAVAARGVPDGFLQETQTQT
ncbi:hypothetical protein LTR84_003868 [Exophiala bonariae]|uniref:Vps72/YL1 C-terminal domain-containing protein n=1 Tax=Exophiala bonariae TaxID=1690606 RepID=A0AAV9NA39_9EURO|nr:hypothetical protein LTR84_003868 [Exophiala bonariae]